MRECVGTAKWREERHTCKNRDYEKVIGQMHRERKREIQRNTQKYKEIQREIQRNTDREKTKREIQR